MKKLDSKMFLVLGLVVLLSLTFVSANIFGDLWNSFTGKVINIGENIKIVEPSWTQWYNRDNPSGVGDFELLSNFGDVCNGRPIKGVECETLDGVNYSDTGQNVTCNTKVGFYCKNADNPNGGCLDYKVRFNCGNKNFIREGIYKVRGRDKFEINGVKGIVSEVSWALQGDTKPMVEFNTNDAQELILHEGETGKFTVGAVTHPLSYNLSISVISINKTSYTAKVLFKSIYEPLPLWTQWYDRDNPSGVGDYELLKDLGNVCNGRPIKGVECETVNGGVNYSDTGQNVTCNTKVGFYCKNADNPNGGCLDYKVRFNCGIRSTQNESSSYCKDNFCLIHYGDEVNGLSLKFIDSNSVLLDYKNLSSGVLREYQTWTFPSGLQIFINNIFFSQGAGNANYVTLKYSKRNSNESSSYCTQDGNCLLYSSGGVYFGGKNFSAVIGRFLINEGLNSSNNKIWRNWVKFKINGIPISNRYLFEGNNYFFPKEGIRIRVNKISFLNSYVKFNLKIKRSTNHCEKDSSENFSSYTCTYYKGSPRLAYIDAKGVKLMINGNLETNPLLEKEKNSSFKILETPYLEKGESYSFKTKGESWIVQILDIFYSSKSSTQSYVKFRIFKSSVSKDKCTNGCFLNSRCYPLGYRKSGEYCNEKNNFVPQMGGNETCENNFQCGSNLCVNNSCISEGFLQKILNWFSRLFG